MKQPFFAPSLTPTFRYAHDSLSANQVYYYYYCHWLITIPLANGNCSPAIKYKECHVNFSALRGIDVFEVSKVSDGLLCSRHGV